MTGPDFWISSGHHLLDRADSGGLLVTDEFLKAYLARPELTPPPEACPVERGLHRELMADPRLSVAGDVLHNIADADARENFSVFLTFRDHLLGHRTLEEAYLALFRSRVAGLPALFVQQLVHVIARNAFDGVEDVMVLRAAECLFRPQRVSVHDNAALLADAEMIASHEHSRQHSPLLAMLGGPAVSELTVLTQTNLADYWSRSDAHDFVLNLTQGMQGRVALGRAAQIWIRHLTGIDLELTPVERFDDQRVAWFIAFDAQATEIGNAVWRGESLRADAMTQVLALYRFTLPDDRRLRADLRGKAGFALAASDASHMLMIKPQNLVLGLPLADKDG